MHDCCHNAVIMLYIIIFHPTPGFVEFIIASCANSVKIELSVNVHNNNHYASYANFYADYNGRMCVIFPELPMLYTR